ncbi:MaoC/PaaZ C-terminal domain-containing protein [Adlercreutzia sp. R7]|uniref:MaoC/PaaZ C-terminal domain-containing protein n=1 Tax=Adlercreutzia wanghongyangiae TaxID=3111451 RepID=A0ABU6IKF6_9ACTN|nr:MaoC/PaaZ C-terminal domain-containing protein [Adlercreutzia sp. R7]
MTVSTEIVGRTFGPFVRDYTFRDLEICALGCGAGWDGRTDLEYVNEHDATNPQLKVLPIFGVPLTVNEEMTTTLDYGFDYAGSLHYGIDAFFHAPFKMNDHVETYVTQEALWDRGEGRGSLSKQVGRSYSADGTHLCTVETYDCCIYDGGFGGERPPADVVDYPDRAPDLTYEEVCGYQWPLIYRLMGDWHQQHIDWGYTEQTGLARPINHGVCTAGIAMRHGIALLFPGQPERLRRFKCRFTAPVLPGTRLATQVWKVSDAEARFRMVNADAPEDKPFLNAGVLEWE